MYFLSLPNLTLNTMRQWLCPSTWDSAQCIVRLQYLLIKWRFLVSYTGGALRGSVGSSRPCRSGGAAGWQTGPLNNEPRFWSLSTLLPISQRRPWETWIPRRQEDGCWEVSSFPSDSPGNTDLGENGKGGKGHHSHAGLAALTSCYVPVQSEGRTPWDSKEGRAWRAHGVDVDGAESHSWSQEARVQVLAAH